MPPPNTHSDISNFKKLLTSLNFEYRICCFSSTNADTPGAHPKCGTYDYGPAHTGWAHMSAVQKTKQNELTNSSSLQVEK